MLKRTYIVLQWAWLMLLASSSLAQQSTELRVSATVPPPPCEFPDPCEFAAQTAISKVTVDNDSVHYVGSRPTVERQDGVIVVIF